MARRLGNYCSEKAEVGLSNREKWKWRENIIKGFQAKKKVNLFKCLQMLFKVNNIDHTDFCIHIFV